MGRGHAPRSRPRRARSGRRASGAATAARRPRPRRRSRAGAQRRACAAELPGRRAAAAAAGRARPPAGRGPRRAVRPVPRPAQLRREQARLRRAALIADQLGDRDLPLYFVDFMVVEDASVELGFDAPSRRWRAARAASRRHRGRLAPRRRRIAEDERCRYVDALRPYIERIDADLTEEEARLGRYSES